MTELLYLAESNVKSIETMVTELDSGNHAVVLGQTIFYPGGGGQPPDFGELHIQDAVKTVNRARIISGKHYHILSKSDTLPMIGDKVIAKINWEHRYSLMRTHTAMHILCGVIFRDYGASVTGGNMEPLQGRMDFEFETIRKELIDEIERSINFEVDNARPLKWKLLSRQQAFRIPDLIRTKINLLPDFIKEVRVVEIEGLDLQADGGTHVENTSLVGKIRIIDYKSKGKINKRIYLKLDDFKS